MIATFLYNFIVFVFVAVCFHILYNQGGKAGNTVEGSAYFVTDRINKSVFLFFTFQCFFSLLKQFVMQFLGTF